MLEARAGNVALARQLFKCAVRADPASEKSWLVRPCARCQQRPTCSCTLA